MGIKSKIKGSYLYTQWKLGKYTKRRVKTSTAIEWPVEEFDRQTNYNDNFYNDKEIEAYKTPVPKPPEVKNNTRGNSSNQISHHHSVHNTPITIMNDIVQSRSMQNQNTISNNNNNNNENRRDVNSSSEQALRKKRDLEKYNRVKLKKSDINDVLVPSKNYALVQKSDSCTVAYYTPVNTRKGKREVAKSYSYTSNAVPSKNI